MTNSERFISAFNSLDKILRNIYSVRGGVGFSEMIRQLGHKNALLKHYGGELYDYSRLRNAIVHNTINNEVIAEPHTKVVEKMEHILAQVLTPPLAKDILNQEKVLSCNAADTLKAFLAGALENHYTHLPVYSDGKVVGVINPRQVTESLGEEMLKSGCISNEFLTSKTVGMVMGKQSSNYIFESTNLSAVQAITYFQENRALKAILLTQGGDLTAPVHHIITAKDAVDFQKIIF